MESPVNNPKSGNVSVGVGGPSIQGGSPLMQGFESQNTFTDSMRMNPMHSKLVCPRFDETDFLGCKLKVEQFFEAVNLSKEKKVQTVRIHLDGKALQRHQRFMRSKGPLKSIEWPSYVLEMRCRFSDNEYSDPMAELVSLKQITTVEE